MADNPFAATSCAGDPLESALSRDTGLGRAWSLLEGSRGLALCQALVSIIEGFAEAAILTLFARLALHAVGDDDPFVYIPGAGESSVSLSITVLIALVLLRFVAGVANVIMATRLQFRFVADLRASVLKRYSTASWEAQSGLDAGTVQQLVVTLPNGVSGQLASLIVNLGHCSMMVAMIGYAFFTDAYLTMMLLVVVMFATLSFGPLRKWIRIRTTESLDEQRSLSSQVAELAVSKYELQAFGVSNKFTSKLMQSVGREAALQARAGRLKGLILPLYTTLTFVAVTFGLIVFLNTAQDDLGQTGPVFLVVLRSLSYGTAIQQAAAGLSSLLPSLNVIRDRLSELRVDPARWGDRTFEHLKSISFEHVSFAYRDEQASVLKDVSIDLQVGSKIGLIGPSGSGKSTFVRLLLGIIEPDSGRVLINGQPVRSYDREAWSSRLGVVPQFPTITRGTIRENLRFFRDGIQDTDLWYALDIADLANEVRSLPDGLSTKLGADGWVMSGGQLQRFAIARALAGQPNLIVMDEPTSSIDAISEGAVSEALSRLADEVTVLVVSHRMGILQGCDQVVVFDRTRIVAAGSPAAVLELPGYAQLLDGGCR